MLNVGKDDDSNTGLNKFVWDMRIDMLPVVPTRPPTAIVPIVPPGEYQARLTVDGAVETQRFRIFLNPKEPFTQAQADAKFAFWMDMYKEAKIYTDKVIEALKTRDEVSAKVEALKSGGASEDKVKQARDQADVIARTVGDYEASFVSTGRTLAEIINLPATIFYKMAYLSGMLEITEGPATTNMKNEFKTLVEEAKAADEKFRAAIEPELKKFQDLIK